jgi:hypothetical protein
LENAFLILENISKEKDLNTLNRRGKTALFYAKDPKMLYLILYYGADPTAGYCDDRSLLEEFLRKNPENARALLNFEARDVSYYYE